MLWKMRREKKKGGNEDTNGDLLNLGGLKH